MSDEIKKLEKIQQRLIKAQQERDKLAGRQEAAIDELRKLGYKSVAEATKALAVTVKEADKAAKELEEAITAFTEKYPELVEVK